jgi:hypothetical protein
MKPSDITRIGRPLDPKYPTNVAIVFLSLFVAVVLTGLSYLDSFQLLPALVEGVRAGVTFFLGWAIAREYDPDHPYAAFLAASAILAVTFLGFTANLFFLALLLLVLRYINRSTGLPATVIDLTAGLLLAAWLSWTMDWIVALLAAAGYALDGWLMNERRTRMTFAAIALAIAVAAWLWGPTPDEFSGIHARVLALAAGFALLSLPLYLTSRMVTSVGDLTKVTLNVSRVRCAQIFYMASTLIIGLKMGIHDSGEMMAAGSVIVGSSIYYLLSKAVSYITVPP